MPPPLAPKEEVTTEPPGELDPIVDWDPAVWETKRLLVRVAPSLIRQGAPTAPGAWLRVAWSATQT